MDWVREEEGLVPPRPGNQLQGGDGREETVRFFVRSFAVSEFSWNLDLRNRQGRENA